MAAQVYVWEWEAFVHMDCRNNNQTLCVDIIPLNSKGHILIKATQTNYLQSLTVAAQ